VSRQQEIPMTAGKRRRWVWIVAAVLALLVAGGIAGFRIAVAMLRDRVVESLGPESEIAEIRMGWSSLDVVGVRIAGPEGWPASDAFRAERVTIVPRVSSALSDQLQVQSITVTRPYLSALRSRDGRLRVLPGLLTGVRETEPPLPG